MGGKSGALPLRQSPRSTVNAAPLTARLIGAAAPPPLPLVSRSVMSVHDDRELSAVVPSANLPASSPVPLSQSGRPLGLAPMQSAGGNSGAMARGPTRIILEADPDDIEQQQQHDVQMTHDRALAEESRAFAASPSQAHRGGGDSHTGRTRLAHLSPLPALPSPLNPNISGAAPAPMDLSFPEVRLRAQQRDQQRDEF